MLNRRRLRLRMPWLPATLLLTRLAHTLVGQTGRITSIDLTNYIEVMILLSGSTETSPAPATVKQINITSSDTTMVTIQPQPQLHQDHPCTRLQGNWPWWAPDDQSIIQSSQHHSPSICLQETCILCIITQLILTMDPHLCLLTN